MRYALSLSDKFLAQHGLDRSTLQYLAEQEEMFLASSRHLKNTKMPLPQTISRSEIKEIVRQELVEFGADAFPPPSFFRTSGALIPRRHHMPRLLPAVASAGTDPQPRGSSDWTWIRGRVINATDTYHSYSGEAGGGQCTGRSMNERERVYCRQLDGTYRWHAFTQCSRSRLAGSATKNLDQMVRDVGGDPATFNSRMAMAKFILDREQPLRVVREEDEGEIYCGSFPVNLGPPASQCYWGVGRWENGILHMEACTQEKAEEQMVMQ